MVQANIPPPRKLFPTPILPLPGDLAPIAQEVVNTLIESESGGKVGLDKLLQMIETDPVSSVAVALKAMRAVTTLGLYTHSDKTLYPRSYGNTTIAEWVQGNFESMRGSLTESIRRMVSQCYALGFSVAQIVWTSTEPGMQREWRLKSINILDPGRVESFKNDNGQITGIDYRDAKGKSVFIPYQNLLHIYTDTLKGNNQRGDAHARRAYPFFMARQLLFKAWAIAGQKQATGTTVIQAPAQDRVTETDPEGVEKLNPDGSPKTISAIEAAKRQGQNLENNSIFVTDLVNKIFNLPGNAGEHFFNIATIALKKEIFLCYGIPSTIFDDTSSGIGNSGINSGHRLILDVQTDAIVLSVKEQLLEKIVRPLLTWNFGIRNNFGNFASEKFLDPSFATTRVGNLITAFTTGTIDTNDLEAMNRLREDLGINQISTEEFDKVQLERLQQNEQEQEPIAENE